MKTRLVLALAAGLLLAADDPEAVKKEQAKLAGTWTLVGAEENGKPLSLEPFKNTRLVIEGSRIITYRGDKKETTTYRIDPTKTPKTIDGTNERGRVERGIYELDGDSLKICYTYGEERPATFATKPGSKVALIVLRRVKP